ncbi:COG0714 domain-containing protein [Histoplasma ohiense]|nr:COG0714 domain-containing protein [Histoplasma ohiense (nom. inval.)]
MEYSSLHDRIEDLSDIEAVVLLSLVARQHCIIDTEREVLDDLENELILIAENIFGLSHATLDCSPNMTVEEFSNAVLAPDAERQGYDRLSPFAVSGEGGRSVDRLSFGGGRSSSRVRASVLDDRKVVNVVIAKNFDQAPDHIQLLTLDLIRTKRIYTRTSFHSVPMTFLFIPLIESKPQGLSSSLNLHLNDHIFMSYYHDPQNGLMNLEESSGWLSDDQGSISSVIRKPSLVLSKEPNEPYLIREEHINALRELSDNVTFSAEISSYLQDIIIALRMNRGVAGGLTPISTRHFQLLARCLAPLQRVDYVFPSLVALAARRVYRHRISIADPANDRSLMYGSTLKAVDLILADASPESIIEQVLEGVEAPL